MPYGYEPQKIERFGGLNTLVDPTNLPNYASPDCSDVEFLPGLVRTRPGTTSIFTALGGNPTVNYLKTYITPTVLLRTLVLDSLGNFYKENPIGTLALIGQIENTGVYGNSVSLFGREYIAFGDGKIGAVIPRQFDDTNLDRVSQVGPGLAPSASDESLSLTVAAAGVPGAAQLGTFTIPAGGASEVGNIVTIAFGNVFLTNYPDPGDNVVIAGVGVAGYNGTFPVASVTRFPASFTYFNPTSGLAVSGGGTADFQQGAITTTAVNNFAVGQLVTTSGIVVGGYNVSRTSVRSITSPTIFVIYLGVTGLGNSGGGTATPVGNISAGVHKISVVFKTRQGYITMPAPPGQWTASGLKRVVIANIPVGPSNVIARLLLFTAAGGSSFFYLTGVPQIFSSNFVVADNTTTAVTVDFSDAVLLTGTNADSLFKLVELGECAGVADYASRLFWWGERNKVQNFVNLTFDGGFSSGIPGPLPHFPLGWTQDTVFSPGGAQASVQGDPIIWGDAYSIVGNGTTATRGLITQSAVQDINGVPIIQPSVGYSVRARIGRNSTLAQGTLHIHLFGTGVNTTGLQVTAAQATTSYVEYTAVLTAPLASIPSDLVLRVYADGTPNQNGDFFIDGIEIFPTNQPFNTTLVRASKVEDPESYDGVTGFLDVAPSNGQAARASFVIRNNLYFAKERSLYVTQDDGVNEPDQWTIQEVSQKVGTLSVRGAGLGDEWAIIAGQDGVYLFDGGEPQKISQEIQPTWDSINWNLGHLIDVKVDIKRKRVYIAMPLGTSATANNRILTLDYTEGFGDPLGQNGFGRKWSPWLIAANSMNLILRNDGTQQLWFGNGTGISAATGKIYQLDTTGTVFADDGAAINSYWQSGFFQAIGRLNFGYIVANVTGSGTSNLLLRKGDQNWLSSIRGWFLNANGFRNMERQINMETERLAIRLGTNAVAANFSLQGMQLLAKTSPWAEIRGINASA